MNEKILISYIIPAYNAADTLERAVESITHTCNMEKCEILIVENGSTDYTNSVALKLIQKYGENVKLIHSEKGVSRARNEGLKNARGEWIVFVDADDYIVSKSKKYIYEDILNAKADLYVYSYEIGNRANYINNKEEKTYYFNDSAEKMKLEMIANPTKFMQVWGKIFRKSIIYENRIGFNTKMQLSEDSDFTLHYLMHCSRISISDTIFYHYSIDNESTMRSNADKKVLQYIEAMNITSKYIEKQHENVQLAFNDYILMHLNIACVRGIFCVNNKENYVKKIEHTVMLGFMTTDTDVGYYNAAVKIKVILVSVVTSLGTVLLPRASYYIQRGELKEFHRITRKALNFVFLMATPLFVYFIYFAKEGIFFLSGNNYVGSIIPMQVIMPTLLLIGITNILGIQILVPTGREKIVLYSEIVGAVVDVIINALLIPVYASTGAAIGTLVAEFAVFVVQFYALKDEILNTFRQIHYIKILIALSVGSIVSLWVKILNLECFFSLVISSLLFFGAYGFVLLILKEELFVEIFNTIKNKII